MNTVLTIYLVSAVLVVCYLLYFVIRTRVPFVATPKEVLNQIIEYLPITSDTILYDLGCGQGRLLFAVEKLSPKKLVGFELSPLHVLYARTKATLKNSKVQFIRKNFFKADISEANLIYLFLVPAMVKKSWEKIRVDCAPGTMVATLADTIPNTEPTAIVPLFRRGETFSNLYLYRVPEKK